MAVFCPVCPAHMYVDIKKWNERYIRNNLFLAHDVVEHPKEYTDAFVGVRHFSFMDNSLVELGGAVDLNMVKEAVRITRSQVFVLPDVLGEGQESTERTIAAYNDWKVAIPQALPMAVVQGKDYEDWVTSLEGIAKSIPGVPWVAIPRHTETWKYHGYRMPLVELAHMYLPHARIHLLGFSDRMDHDLFSARHPAVSSIDSAVPLRLGTQGKPFGIFSDPGKRGNWWETCRYTPYVGNNIQWVSLLVHTHDQMRHADISI